MLIAILLVLICLFIHKNAESGGSDSKSKLKLGLPPEFVTRSMKNSFLFVQVLSRTQTTFQVSLPSLFLYFNFFDFLQLDIFDTLPMACVTGVSYYQKLIVSLLLPIILTFMVFTSTRIMNRISSHPYAAIVNSGIRAWVVLIFLIYNTVTEVLHFILLFLFIFFYLNLFYTYILCYLIFVCVLDNISHMECQNTGG